VLDIFSKRDLFTARAAARDGETPLPLLMTHVRQVAFAVATAVVLLSVVEIGVFRSGFFTSHLAVTSPDFPSAKLALAARHANAAMLFVGDSTVLTDLAPRTVTEVCSSCGDGFNGAFSAATPWLTAAMTRQLLQLTHPRVVVLGLSPWTFDDGRRFTADDRAREFLRPDELAALGGTTDLTAIADSAIGQFWSAYRYRTLAKEWFGTVISRQRYDEELRGLYAPPGAYNQIPQLDAAASRLVADLQGRPSTRAAGAEVMGALVREIRSEGRTVIFVVPPLHTLAYERAGSFLRGADESAVSFAFTNGTPVIDCRGSVSDADFRDIDHLLPRGADKFSRCVGERLRDLLETH
jgi:hypothetical protein